MWQRDTSVVGRPAAVGGSASNKIAAPGELDVETAQVGLQPGVLDGDQVRRAYRSRCSERATCPAE